MILAMSPTETPAISAEDDNLADQVVLQLASILKVVMLLAKPAKACRARVCVH